MKIRFQNDWSRNGWSVYVVDYSRGQSIPYEISITRKDPISETERIPCAAIIDREQMTSFVNALKEGLADAGFLADIGPLEGELKATKIHLEDMRKLALK